MAVTNTLGLAGLEPPPAPTRQSAPQTRAAAAVRLPVGGKRVSYDDTNQIAFGGLKILGQLSAETMWREWALDGRTLDRVPAWKLMELLIELSPEISRARWDFLRMCNPGFEVKVTKQGSESEDAEGKKIVDAFFATLRGYYGTLDVPINRLFTALFLRGELVGELVLGADSKAMVDLATPDPRAFDFDEMIDPVRGPVYQLGQWQNGQFIPLNYDTIKHIPLDPLPGNPRGISLISSALFSALFLIGLLHDLRRVVAQQGWPRLDVSLDLAAMIEALPDEIADDPQKFKDAVDTAINEIRAVYDALEPDDTYIHTSVVTVNRPVGTVDASSLGAIDGVIAALERMSVRALKTMPLMLGVGDGVSEANANRQWEIYAAGVKSLQHIVESLLEGLLEVGLRAAGRQAKVTFRFAELRAAELLRDAQVEALQIRNEQQKYAQGYTSQDEGALKITGHKADSPKPRQTAGQAAVGNIIAANPDPGANRGHQTRNAESLALLMTADRQPAAGEIDDAAEWWRERAPREGRTLVDAETKR